MALARPSDGVGDGVCGVGGGGGDDHPPTGRAAAVVVWSRCAVGFAANDEISSFMVPNIDLIRIAV